MWKIKSRCLGEYLGFPSWTCVGVALESRRALAVLELCSLASAWRPSPTREEVLLTLDFMAQLFSGQEIPVASRLEVILELIYLFMLPVEAGPLHGREFKTLGWGKGSRNKPGSAACEITYLAEESCVPVFSFRDYSCFFVSEVFSVKCIDKRMEQTL